MKKLSSLILALMLVLAISVSCTSNNNQASNDSNSNTASPSEEVAVDDTNEVLYFKEEGTPLPKGTGVYKIGMVSSSPFKGMLNAYYQAGSDDSKLTRPTMYSGLQRIDSDFKYRDGGGINTEFDRENKKAIIHIDPKLTWNDGVPVTAKDFEYAYKILGHGEYTGPRFTKDYKNVVGIMEYHWGTMSEETKNKLNSSDSTKMPDGLVPSTEISGVKIIDDKTLEITFKEFGVDILWGSGIASYPVAYHQVKDIPIKDLESSDAVRKNPLSCGPYYITSIVPGESVEFAANKYFYRGEPNIAKVKMQIISPDKLVESIKSGEFDQYTGIPNSKYEEIKDLDNINIVKESNYSYGYIGFKLGKWDNSQGKNIYNPESKMADLNLRKAMEMSIDIDLVSKEYTNGLSYRGSTIIPTLFEKLHDKSLKAIEYNMDEAKRILDEAGYKDIDGDGKRENPKGEKLVINVAMMEGTDISKQINTYYMQQWQDLGLDVQYTNGRFLEFNNFYDLVEADDENIDVFLGGWSTGSNPDPYGLYGEKARWNFTRYVNPELEAALESVSSDKAFDDKFRQDAFKKIQKIIYDEKPVCITNYGLALTVYNKRVQEVDHRRGDDIPFTTLGDVQLLAEEPIKASNK